MLKRKPKSEKYQIPMKDINTVVLNSPGSPKAMLFSQGAKRKSNYSLHIAGMQVLERLKKIVMPCFRHTKKQIRKLR